MKPITIFRAYQEAEFWRQHALKQRSDAFDIMFEKDRYALEYQRRRRQLERFERELERILEHIHDGCRLRDHD